MGGIWNYHVMPAWYFSVTNFNHLLLIILFLDAFNPLPWERGGGRSVHFNIHYLWSIYTVCIDSQKIMQLGLKIKSKVWLIRVNQRNDSRVKHTPPLPLPIKSLDGRKVHTHRHVSAVVEGFLDTNTWIFSFTFQRATGF